MSRRSKRGGNSAALTDAERRDIMLWFGWGSILGYPTDPKSYLRDAMKPGNKPLLLAMDRPKRKAVLRFVIEEYQRRSLS